MPRPSLHFLAWKLGFAEPITQTTAAERACVAKHAEGRRRLAEIGVFQGVTTAVIRRAMAADGDLYAIDPFYTSRVGICWHLQIARTLTRGERGRIHWIHATGAAAASNPEVARAGDFDFAFIDGDHSWKGIESDWLAWRDRIAVGGRVAFHDSRNDCGHDSERYVREVVLKDPRYALVDEVGTVTVVERRT